LKPSPDSDRAHVDHMLAAVSRIRAYTGLEASTFAGSTLVQDAVLRNLQTLAESSQRLSAECKAREPAVPWRELSGFRNVLVHAYLGVDLEVVWSVVAQDLVPLEAALIRLKASL
jgi:uncharacterized protein with HEPN domain